VKAPDYVEPIVGWRLWHVVERDGRLCLVSPLYRTRWSPRRELVAACRRGLEPGVALYTVPKRRHDAPDPSCGCGLYGGRAAADATAYMTRFFKSREDVLHGVVGTVSLWGTVVEGERGWRASYAYPREIFVPVPVRKSRLLPIGGLRRPRRSPERIADALAAYGVPVRLVECASITELAEIASRPSRKEAA
jgi:hypothetical protein